MYEDLHSSELPDFKFVDIQDPLLSKRTQRIGDLRQI